MNSKCTVIPPPRAYLNDIAIQSIGYHRLTQQFPATLTRNIQTGQNVNYQQNKPNKMLIYLMFFHGWFHDCFHGVKTLIRTLGLILGIGLLGCPLMLRAQVVNTGFADSTGGIRLGSEPLVLGAQLDIYRNWGPSRSQQIPDLVSSSSLNQWAINLALLDLRYQSEQIRSRLMPAFGTYMERNYLPGEPRLLEASLGIKPWKKLDLWIDAGLLGSPFTNENPLSKDQPTYTRSLSAEFVPYYLSGVRIGYTWGPRYSTYVYLVNGWQQAVDRVAGQGLVAQMEIRPSSQWLINLNYFGGREEHASRLIPGNNSPMIGWRSLFDAYALYRPTSKTLLTSSLYQGWQNGDTWAQGNIVAEHFLNPFWACNLRAELLDDPAGIVVPKSGNNGSSLWSGYSMGLKYRPSHHFVGRLEFRRLTKGLASNGAENWPYLTLSATVAL
jgi:hypothetical protein